MLIPEICMHPFMCWNLKAFKMDRYFFSEKKRGIISYPLLKKTCAAHFFAKAICIYQIEHMQLSLQKGCRGAIRLANDSMDYPWRNQHAALPPPTHTPDSDWTLRFSLFFRLKCHGKSSVLFSVSLRERILNRVILVDRKVLKS